MDTTVLRSTCVVNPTSLHHDHHDLAELDAWLGARDEDSPAEAEHPEPCPCDPCRALGIPELAQIVIAFQPSLEHVLGATFPAVPVQIWRTYREVDFARYEVRLTILVDEQSDQLRLDERDAARRALEHLAGLGFEVQQTGISPPTIRISAYSVPAAEAVAA